MDISKSINLNAVKALSKEERVEVAGIIRKDADLWNAVNGMGGLSESSAMARIQGTITKDEKPLLQAKVKIEANETTVEELTTNENGYFKTDIKPDTYTVVIADGKSSEEISVKALQGETSTVEHNFKLDGKQTEDTGIL